MAIIKIGTAEVLEIVGLGRKDHSLAENALDASDQDAASTFATWPVHGLYMPDAIHAIHDRGRNYYIMANEGDAREYSAATWRHSGVNSAAYVLDPTVFPNAAALKANTAIGRLNVSKASGDTDGDGDFDRIDVFGEPIDLDSRRERPPGLGQRQHVRAVVGAVGQHAHRVQHHEHREHP